MGRFKVNKLHHHLWKNERGLTTMLVLICLNDFLVVPLLDSIHLVHVMVNISWMFILLSGIFALAKNRSHAFVISLFPLFYIILRWILLFHQEFHFLFLDFLFGFFTLLMLIGMVLIRVFERGPVTVHRIVGSVVVYLLTANLFSLIFQFMFLIVPGSFNIDAPFGQMNTLHASFLYFSFTTLTTTGYGDILPVGLFARSIVVVEQIIGVLYPIVLIGRLVSLKVEKD